jgi:hypothetical protein
VWRIGIAKHWTLFALFLAISIVAEAQDKKDLVGSITAVKGEVLIVRGDDTLTGVKGARLYQLDVVTTEKNASMGIVLRDDTTLSIGPNSELKMSEFAFEPDEGILGMTLSIAKGTLVYLSGEISKLAPGSAKIETPSGVAAVRGTKLLIEVKAP